MSAIALRIPEALLEELRGEAKRERRSLNAHIVWLLSRCRLLPRDDSDAAVLALQGQFPDIEDVSEGEQALDMRRMELLDRLWQGDE